MKEYYPDITNDVEVVNYYLNVSSKFFGYDSFMDVLNNKDDALTNKVLKLTELLQDEVHKGQMSVVENFELLKNKK